MKTPFCKVIRLLVRVANNGGKFHASHLILGITLLSQTALLATNYTNSVLSSNPVAFWELSDTNNASIGTAPAVDATGHGHNGTYGTTSQNAFNGVVGPQPPSYLGFPTNAGALGCTVSDPNSPVTVPPVDLYTNTVTITMWINPSVAETTFTGLFMNRDSISDAAGFGFGGTVDGTGMAELGYTWNTNSSATWSFNSGLYPVAGIWQFAALVITPGSATIYLYYIDPNTGQPQFGSAVNAIPHTLESFANGTTVLGADVANGSGPDGTRVFAGDIADVAVYNSALTQDQLLSLFAAGVGVTGFLPSISGQPVSQYALANSRVQFSTTGITGASPLAYQWQLNGTNVNFLADNANFSGANSNVLTILSATANDTGSYQLIVNNSVGSTASSNATLTIQSPSLVGEWLDGSTAGTNLLDVSGYSLAANHGGFFVGGGNYEFTNDVPLGKTGQSIFFYNGDTGIAVSNSSTLDPNPDNTFDNRINNAFTIAFWAKDLPGAWNPWVSKYGETEAGWQLRDDGRQTNDSCFTVRDNNAGTNFFGTGGDDMGTRSTPTSDGNWHLYVGTYNASTGVRNLYIDGAVLAASEGSNTLYNLASAEHLCIGAKDSPPGNTFGNFFMGEIYDVRVYNYELASNQIEQLYGVTVPAVINVQPQSVSVINQESARIIATAGGTLPLNYQWQLNGTNIGLLADSANFIGANSNILTIVSATTSDAGLYQLVVNNGYGTGTSSNALVTVVPRYLVGSWLHGAASLADVSGFQPPGTHDGYAINGTNYQFSSDVPPGRTGVSLYLNNTDTAIAISNSSTSDPAYTNTFDDTINNAMTVAFWAKGWPGGWSPFVSKNGDSGSPNSGWDLRNDGNNNVSPCWTMRGTGGTVTLGTAVYGNPEDMAATSLTYGNDGNWHAYIGTFNAGTGIRNLYVDGNLVASENGDSPYVLPSPEHLVIGGIDHSPGNTFVSFFTGKIYDVRVYNYDWNTNEVAAFSTLPDPVINGQPPQSILGYVGLSTKITVSGISGTAPITTQWQLNGTNISDGSLGGATIVGSASNVLTIANLTTNVQGTYHLVVSNPKGLLVSSNSVLTVVLTVPPPGGDLIGAWLTGATNLADTSGYSPAGTHDGYGVFNTNQPASNYSFTNDVPAGQGGQSLVLMGNTAIAISNSSTLDAAYTNTFDDALTTNMTVTFWAKGLPGGWNPWVSKFGENGVGWQYRVGNPGNEACWTVRDNSSGSYTLGSGPVWAPTGDQDDLHSAITIDGSSWHYYAGTFDGTAGIRNLYIDGILQGQEIGNVPFSVAASSYLCIGGKDSGGAAFGNYFVGNIYNVRIYNTVLSPAQINNGMLSTQLAVPIFNGPPLKQGHNFVLSWSTGTLLQATNLHGPWTPTGATSPYTNDVRTAPEMFFRLSNP